jgi:hypothetical protein
MHRLVATRNESPYGIGGGMSHGMALALFARVTLLVVWTSTPLVSRAFHEYWLLPLLGILILPVTTLIYVIVFALVGKVSGWNRLWVVLAFLLDLSAQSYPARHTFQAKKERHWPSAGSEMMNYSFREESRL